MLYIVSTPIGNLSDITLRALETLKSVDFICCEDTRHSGILLNHFEIKKPLLSFHSHSTDDRVAHIIHRLKSGESSALISDAGTPGISDPAWSLVTHCIEEGIKVCPIPGASATITALVASGLPTDKFIYLGFLPLKKGRHTLFESLKSEDRTIVFYESPLRIIRTLEQIAQYLGETTRVVIARELTKIHEEFIRGTIVEVITELQSRPSIKGEVTVIMKND